MQQASVLADASAPPPKIVFYHLYGGEQARQEYGKQVLDR